MNDMQFGFMPGKGTTNALLIVRRMQEKYKDKKLFMCFVDLKKAFDSKNSNAMGTEKERTTRNICESSDESV